MNPQAYVSSSIWLNHSLWAVASVVLSFGPIVFFAYVFIKYRQTKVRGPAVMGTAQILSLKVAPWVIGNPGSGERPCMIRLRVNVPGREPYETTIRQNFERFVLGLTVQPGRTVPVLVEEANREHVGIDVSRPPTVVNMPPTPSVPVDIFNQNPRGGPVLSAADLIASGQRVSGVLKSFAPMGTTPRSMGRTPSMPELLDAPHYTVEGRASIPEFVIDWASAESEVRR